MTPPLLVAAGGAHIDRRGRVQGDYVPAASNPVTMHEEVGGGAFNALRTAVRRGVGGAILSLRGADAGAETVATAIARAGIEDLSAIYLDRSTPSYTAVLDREGELIAGFADMGLYDFAFAKQVSRRKFRDAVARADALLTDANMSDAALARLTALAGDKPVYAIAISPAKAVRLLPLLDRLSVLFMNMREARALAGMAAEADAARVIAALRGRGLRRAVVTAGSGAVLAFDGETDYSLTPPPVEAVADVTGAGDALAGAAIAALMRGAPFGEALRDGVAAARLAVLDTAAVPEFDAEGFAAALATIPQPASPGNAEEPARRTG